LEAEDEGMTHEKSVACMHSDIEKLKTSSLFVVHKEPGIRRSDKKLILDLTDLPKIVSNYN